MKLPRIAFFLSAAGLLAFPAGACADGNSLAAMTNSTLTSGTSSDDAPVGSTSTSSSSTTTTATAPTITTQPVSTVVNAGASATLSVTASGTGTLQYQWLKDGMRIRNATTSTLTLNPVTAHDAGIYSVVVSNDAGRVTSSNAALDVNVVAGTVTTGPQDVAVNAGASASFTVTTTGTGLTYQWRHDGWPLSGETNATLNLTNVGVLSAGAYSVTVSNATGVAAVADATLTVNTDARLTNISARGQVGTGDNQLIVGFVIRGQGSKQILLRAVGPTLGTQFNVSGALADPVLTLHGYSHGQVITDTNSGWGGSATLTQAFTQVGAFPLPAGSADAALLETLDRGGFTANVTSASGQTGVALAELYDADTGSPSAELVNISARARVGAQAANTLIAGFAISGTTSDTVLIRGVGPSLGTLFGMREALGASQVTLFDSKGNQIATNSNWSANAHGDEDAETETDMDNASDRVGAFRLEHGSHDSAIIATLPPGVYTAHVTGVNKSTGVALVEIYEVR
ncbi:MAG TPA: immunoglobulin domain-containing protein [Opitutaceae bacterium]|nr:immunoglobulin domain-containing protein [Opitutaceae bacterium]